MRSPRHRPGTRVPSPSALAPPPTPAGDEPRADRARRAGGPRQPAGEHHDPGRELAAPRLFVLAVDCELRAGASPAVAPAAALTARAGDPARGHPAAAPVTRTLCAVGLFPGGMLAVRRAREPGHSAAGRPANQATGFPAADGNVTGHGPIITSASRTATTRRCQQPGYPRGWCAACLSRRHGCLAVLFSCADQFPSDRCGTHQDRPWR
jgi:hypothetical protein